MSEKPLTHQQGMSFAEALDDAIGVRGVTLTHLHRRLGELATPVSLATLSYWRSGRSEPERQTSLAAVEVLEELLGLPDGELSRWLRPGRRSGIPTRHIPIGALTGNEEAMHAALGSLGFETASDEVAEDAAVLSLDVDAEGRAHRIWAMVRWRALVDDAQRAALVLTLDGPEEDPPLVTARAGVALGRGHTDHEHLIHVSELHLERPLARGETAYGEYEIAVDGTPMADSSLSYLASRRVQQVLVWVRFDRARLPRRFEAYDAAGGHEVTEPMSLGDGHSLLRRAGQYGPGTMGIRWFW